MCCSLKSAGRFILDGCLTWHISTISAAQTYFLEHDSLCTYNMTWHLPISAMLRKLPSMDEPLWLTAVVVQLSRLPPLDYHLWEEHETAGVRAKSRNMRFQCSVTWWILQPVCKTILIKSRTLYAWSTDVPVCVLWPRLAIMNINVNNFT